MIYGFRRITMKSVLSALTSSFVCGEKRHGARLLALLCFFFALFPFRAAAQEATIVGTVTDPTGAAVPNAAITVTNTDTGVVSHLTTNTAGDYVAADIHIGHYTVRAEATGFKVGERTDIVLAVGDRIRADFKLELGTTQQHITVEAAPVAVQTDSGEISHVVTGQEVLQLATNGRSIYTLATLVPGAVNNMTDDQAPTSIGGDRSVAFNGLRTSHNIWLVDGAESDDRGSAGEVQIMPSLDAIAEFNVLTSNYSGDYALASGGTMSLVFKSGTKQLHASAWEFARNDAFDAGNFLSNAANAKSPELRFNTFGFNVGGPVVFPGYNKNRNKTFFFYNMEWRRIVNGAAPSSVGVPPKSEYPDAGGDVTITGCSTATPLPKGAIPCALVPTIPAAALTAVAGTGQGLPTLATDIVGQVLTPGALFPGYTCSGTTCTEMIPKKYTDANAALLLGEGIFPQSSTGIVTSPVKLPTTVREEVVRIDHHFNDKVSIFGHYAYDSVNQTYATTEWTGDNVPTAGTDFVNPANSYVIHFMDSISPTLLNEVAFNEGWNAITFNGIGTIKQPSGLTIPRIFASVNPSGNSSNFNPDISLSGTTGTTYSIGGRGLWQNAAGSYQLRDDLSWVKGPHQLKFGGSWLLYKKWQQSATDTAGGFGFSGYYSGYDYADFLLGTAASYSEAAVTYIGHFPSTSWAAYVQDNWRATRKLTVNLGLRWDGIPHTTESNGQASDFYPNLYNSADAAVVSSSGNICTAVNLAIGCSSVSPTGAFGKSANSILASLGNIFYLNGIGTAGANGIPKGLVDNHWANFGPRIGFAYDLTGAGKTVIRGGFGMMYEREQGNDMYNGLGNVPFGWQANPSYVWLSNPSTSLVTGSTVDVTDNPPVAGTLAGLSKTDYKNAYSMQYSLGIQRQLGRDSILSIAYVGNQNRHQSDYRDINLPPQSDLAGIITGSLHLDQVVPYAGWDNLAMAEQAENSHYNALQISLRSKLHHDLTLEAAYTLSRAIDPMTGYGQNNPDDDEVSNPYNRNYDIGPSMMDRTHVAFVSFVYDIPFLRHSNNRALRTGLGGWEISGIGTMETGLPLQIAMSGTQATNGLPNGWGGGPSNSSNRPDVTGAISYPKTLADWVSPSSFSSPVIGDWGTLGKGAVRAPGRDNWNISLFKDFVLSENRGSLIELRFESFNTPNHTEFNGVNSSFPASNFGSISSVWDPRIFQFALKLKF
jgi:hypothetical protein